MELHLSELMLKAMAGQPTCTPVCGVPAQSPHGSAAHHTPRPSASPGAQGCAGAGSANRRPSPRPPDPRAPEHSTFEPFSDLPLHVLTKTLLILSQDKSKMQKLSIRYDHN